MGLPEVIVRFQSLAVTAIRRSSRGIVALVLVDVTKPFVSMSYRSIDEVVATDWTAANYDFIRQAFLGAPSRVLVEKTTGPFTDALLRLRSKRFSYLAAPTATTEQMGTIAAWIKSQRDNDHKTFRAVLANQAADHEGVINFTTGGIVVGAATYTAAQYTPRIAGILAGMRIDRSATYYPLGEVTSIAESADPDADINAGRFILINDGSKIKVGRGINSLVTTSSTKGSDFKKIRIVETLDMIRDDISSTFTDAYVGSVVNTYDNKVLFFAAVNAYLRTLAGDNLLDPTAVNEVGVDIEAQRTYLQSIGVDVSALGEQEIKEYNTGSKVFGFGRAKPTDAMEDLLFVVAI